MSFSPQRMIGSALESLQDLYQDFLSQSLFIPLIAPYKKSTPKAGAQGISIALVIHSFDRTLHIAIAVIIHSFDRTGFLSHSLLSRLIAIHSLDPALGLTKAGRISIALLNQSVDRTLQMHYKCTKSS